MKELEALNSSATVRRFNIQLAGGKYFYYKRNPGEDFSNIYYINIKTGNETLLFVPKAYAKDKNVNVSYSSNYDGSLLLLFITEQGSEIGDLRMLDVKTKKLLPDILPHVMSGDFVKMRENKIVYFQVKNYDLQDQENAINPKTMLHTPGTAVTTDKTVLSSKKYPQLLDSVGWVNIKTFPESPYIFAEKTTSSNYKQLYYALVNELEAE